MKKNVRIFTFHKLKIIFCQFERSFLEPEVTRRTANDKAKINMDNMPVTID